VLIIGRLAFSKTDDHEIRMPRLKALILALCFLFAASFQSFACDTCGCYIATKPEGETRSGFFLSVAEQFTRFGTLQFEGTEVPNPTNQRLDSSITQAILGYSFSPRFSLQANVPFIYRSFKRPDGFKTDEGTESGLGDVSLVGKFLVWRKDTDNGTFTWNILGGAKFPTGNTSRIQEEFHELEVEGAPVSGIHGHDLTLGSGSFDGILGSNFYFRYKRTFLIGAVQYSIRTEGDFEYRFANDLSWEGGPGFYVLLERTHTLALQAAVSGEHKGTDTFRGEQAEDTGITSVYLGPRITATWRDRLSADVALEMPISIQNTALQAVPDFRVRAGLTWRF
jgi:hypothetical protein